MAYEVVEMEPAVVGGETFSGAVSFAAEYVILKGHGVTVPIRRDQLAEMTSDEIDGLLESYNR